MTYINKMWALTHKKTGELEGYRNCPWIYHSREDAREGKRISSNSRSYKVVKVKVIVERI